MSGYLLDTCVVSEFIKEKPNQELIHWLDQQDEETLYISVLTLAEIQKGIFKLENKNRKKNLEVWLRAELMSRFEYRIVPISPQITLKWGELCGEHLKLGIVLPVIDALLMSSALEHNFTFVSRDSILQQFSIKRFSEIKTLNPFK